MKSGNLNFLEPSGPLQAYNGTDLPLSFYDKKGDKNISYVFSYTLNGGDREADVNN